MMLLDASISRQLSQLFPVPSGDALRFIFFTYSLCAFQTAAFAPGPGVGKTIHKSFERTQFPIALWYLGQSCWFSKALETHFSGVGPKVWGALYGAQTLRFSGRIYRLVRSFLILITIPGF